MLFGPKLSARGPLLATLLLLLASGFAGTTLAEGFYYEAVQTVTDNKNNDQTQWRVRGWVDGSSAKIEFLDSMSPLFPAGTYMVTSDGASDVFLVDPNEETYTRWDLEAMFAAFGSVMEGMDGMVNLDFTDFASETLKEEAGPKLLGYDTQHVEYTTAYTMKLKVMGMRRTYNVNNHQNVWVTDQIDAPGMFLWLKVAPSTGDADFDEMIRSEMNRVDGLPLKVQATSRVAGKKKKREQVSTSTMEVTKLEPQTLAASTFEVPAGYTETEADDDPTGMGSISSIFGKKSGE